MPAACFRLGFGDDVGAGSDSESVFEYVFEFEFESVFEDEGPVYPMISLSSSTKRPYLSGVSKRKR